MNVGSLFSGIGGLDLGLERAGMHVIWQCESDPYCRAVLRKHWPEVPCYEDVRDIGDDTPRPDLLCGGFPCQPVSVAGKRLAQQDERWLWPEFARCIRLLRPRVVLVENVPGLLTGGMGDVLGDLAACGYDAEWDCIPAAAFGAPHLRYRVFIVAHSNGRKAEKIQRGGRVSDINWDSSIQDEGWEDKQHGPCESGDVAHAESGRLQGGSDANGEDQEASERGHGKLARGIAGEKRNWWSVEPNVGRVADGVPSRVDRLGALGNAVVPQVAEWIGKRIKQYAQAKTTT